MGPKTTLTEYYTAESLAKTVLGYWLKVSFEWLVTAVPVFAVLSILTLLVDDLHFSVAVSRHSIGTIGGAVTTTVTGFAWCLSTHDPDR